MTYQLSFVYNNLNLSISYSTMEDSSIHDSLEEREPDSEERQGGFLRQRGAENASGRRSRRDSEVRVATVKDSQFWKSF